MRYFAMEQKHKHFIKSVARGLSILQAFSSERPKLTLTQLATITGMNRTAVQRFTDTLMELGFLGRNKHKEFFLGPKVFSLGFAYLQGSKLIELADSTDQRIRDCAWTIQRVGRWTIITQKIKAVTEGV